MRRISIMKMGVMFSLLPMVSLADQTPDIIRKAEDTLHGRTAVMNIIWYHGCKHYERSAVATLP